MPISGVLFAPVGASCGAIVPVWVAETVPELFVAATVKLKAPAVVGVPEMTPVVSSRTNPAGSAPALIENVAAGLPTETGTVKENGVPSTGVGRADGAVSSAARSTAMTDTAELRLVT